MKALKYLVVIAAFVAIGGMVADSWAQCQPGRLFRSSGKLGANIDIDTTGAENGSNVIGYLWDSDDASNSNSGFAPNYGSRCPVQEWWYPRDVAAPAIMKIDGVQGAGTCIGAGMGCPANKMTIVIEDYDANGPPGIQGDAYYAAFMVDETPASGRWYDYGAMDMLPNNSVIPMLPFPEVVFTHIARLPGPDIEIGYQLLDQSQMVHSTDWAGGGGIFPAGDVIKEWQLVQYTGTGDPGRARALGWVTLQTTPYTPGGAANLATIPCLSTVTDAWVAIGIGFNGGAYGTIDSALVGRAWALECDPNLADPDDPAELDRKPKATQLHSKPHRSEGRR